MGTTVGTGKTTEMSEVTPSHLAKVNVIMRRVCDTTQGLIDILPEGHKISLKTLTEKVSTMTDLPQSQVTQIVSMFVKNYDQCTVQKGRFGGIYRGSVPKKSEQQPRCDHCGQKIRNKRGTNEKNEEAGTPSGEKAA